MVVRDGRGIETMLISVSRDSSLVITRTAVGKTIGQNKVENLVAAKRCKTRRRDERSRTGEWPQRGGESCKCQGGTEERNVHRGFTQFERLPGVVKEGRREKSC